MINDLGINGSTLAEWSRDIENHNLQDESFRLAMVFMYKIKSLLPPAWQVGQMLQHAQMHNTNAIIFTLLLYIIYLWHLRYVPDHHIILQLLGSNKAGLTAPA